MAYQKIRGILAGEDRSAGAEFLRALLWPFGQGYGAAMALRAFAYRKQLLRSFAVPAPVISIGNLVCGGTGKTPFAALLCRRLAELGRKPAVLLRGYGVKRGAIPEEALWLAQRAGKALVQVDVDRVRGALAALRAGADVLVLDDGFQHLRLRRDLDIVLVDATAPWPGRCPLPGGLLREFPSALRRTHVIFLTRCEQSGPTEIAKIEEELRCWTSGQTIIGRAYHHPVRLTDFSGAEHAMPDLRACRLIALCGIGNPCAFIKTVRGLGAEVIAERFFPDHHAYTPAEVAAVEKEAEKMSALIACTEKDAIKLEAAVAAPRRWRIVGVEITLEHEHEFMARVQECLRKEPGGIR